MRKALHNSADSALVDEIRASSRLMVRELGFMQATLAATDYSASAVHAIIELGLQGTMSAAAFGEMLGLEKSSVSRMLRKLIDAGEIEETVSACDGRVKELSLTARGRRTFAGIQRYARQQVSAALARLSAGEQHLVNAGLGAYARALTRRRAGAADPLPTIEIVSGYAPGLIGRVAEMHGAFYARFAGFGQFFEGMVASGLSEFTRRLDRPRNGLWTARRAGQIVGSIAIDGEDLRDGNAHLRWFILDDGLRGGGIGRRLLTEALAFCDRSEFPEVHLWTIPGLDAARRLYEENGFQLVEEKKGKQWGRTIAERRMVRKVAGLVPAAPTRSGAKRQR
jgi:DNA-binding MarR family transcriptional regulator/GNAT superfamily N-acetyltransferase